MQAKEGHAKEACSQAKCFTLNALTAKFLSNALTARLFKALKANSSCCSLSKVLSCSNQILCTCAPCHVPKDNMHLYCLRSFC